MWFWSIFLEQVWNICELFVNIVGLFIVHFVFGSCFVVNWFSLSSACSSLYYFHWVVQSESSFCFWVPYGTGHQRVQLVKEQVVQTTPETG